MHEQLPIPADITIEPRRVGGVAMNGGVERVDREPVVNLVPAEEMPGLTLGDRGKPFHKSPPDLLAGGLGEAAAAWHRSVTETPLQRRRRIAQSLIDHPLEPDRQIRAW